MTSAREKERGCAGCFLAGGKDVDGLRKPKSKDPAQRPDDFTLFGNRFFHDTIDSWKNRIFRFKNQTNPIADDRLKLYSSTSSTVKIFFWLLLPWTTLNELIYPVVAAGSASIAPQKLTKTSAVAGLVRTRRTSSASFFNFFLRVLRT